MLYVPSVSDATSTKPTVTGRNVAHGKRSKAERAFVAADLHLGLLVLATPTIGQAAHLLHVNKTYVEQAVAIANNHAAREAVIAGEVTLLEAANKPVPAEDLAAHFARCSPAEWLEAARVIGPALVWDHMIAPLV